MQYLRLLVRRLLQLAETALLRHGARPRTIFFLAALSALDGFVPMWPAEAFVIALGILQPPRGKVIVLMFALASALSASLSALVLVMCFWRKRNTNTTGARVMTVIANR